MRILSLWTTVLALRTRAHKEMPLPDSGFTSDRDLAEEPTMNTSLGAPSQDQRVALDICLCTHNPRPEILALALRSLARQSVPPGTFRLLLVDNASVPAVTEDVLEPLWRAGHPARLTREPQPGLTAARLHAVRQTSAPWMLFVDDDNELADDFVAQGLQFIDCRDDLGCFGGRLVLPESVHPPRWVEPFLPYLGIRDAGSEVITGAGAEWGPWEPPGAGLWICREQLEAFRLLSETDPRVLELGRTGSGGMASCEDSLMARQSLALGLLNAYNPRLSLRHHLDPSRFRTRYLIKLMAGYGSSHVLLESLELRRQGTRLSMPDRYGQPWRFFYLVQKVFFNQVWKHSFRYALGLVAYHWAARRQYRLERWSLPPE